MLRYHKNLTIFDFNYERKIIMIGLQIMRTKHSNYIMLSYNKH
jgi:hypothetical protein